MSVDHSDGTQAPEPESAAFWTRAPVAPSRSDARLTAQIQDLFIADADRLDDRTRAAAAATLRATVLAIANDLARRVADRALGHSVDRDGTAAAANQAATAVLHRLQASGLLRDRALMEELFARVRQDIVSDALLANRAPGAEPALLLSLAASDDEALAGAALAYCQAERRRRSGWRTDLPGAHRETVLWWAAAALRGHWRADAAPQAARDRAIADAAQRSIAAHDDQNRLEAAADRLAATLGDGPSDLAERMILSLEEGYLALFIALLSRALALDSREVRALVLDPDDDRLWLALRALGLDRAAIARIAFLLAEADPRRDLDAFADRLDTITAAAPQEALDGLATLALPPPFRAALDALDRAVVR